MTQLFHSPERNLLVYETGKVADVVRYVPDAKQLNGSYVAVPKNLHNMQLLRWLDLPVLPPMDGYDWPRAQGFTPTAAQRTMANFMVLHPRSFNLSDMGTMKTLATLWAADFIMRQHPEGSCRAVIVAPLSILQRVWGDAIFRHFLGRRTYQIVYGDERKRKDLLQQPADFYIINFDGLGVGAQTRRKFELAGLSAQFRDRADIRIAIIDEASAYRDSRTKRSRIARILFSPERRPYLWLLTGTPTPNGPCDAYGLARQVNNAFGESFVSFKQRTMIQVSQYKWIPRAGSNEMARKLLSPAIRFGIEQVWDGPELTYQQRDVELTPQQRELFKSLRNQLQVVVNNEPITPANEAAARLKFLQISMGAIYDHAHHSHPVDASPRFREAEAVIEQTDRKVVIFVPLTNVLHLLRSHLSKRWSCGVLNGEVSVKDRNELLARFASSEHPHIILADPQTTAHGINELVAADTIIWFGPTDKTELFIQGNKRLHRPGQKYPVTVVQLVSHAIEREIFRRLENNESQQGVLLRAVKEGKL